MSDLLLGGGGGQPPSCWCCVCGGGAVWGRVHSASALGLILVASRTRLPVQHTHRGGLQSCPAQGGQEGVGICQVSGAGLARDLL